MATMASVEETKQIDIDILRRLLSPVTIGNCINKEKHDEYHNNVIFEYSSDPEVLQNCDIVIGIVRWLYSLSVNSSYDKNNVTPFIIGFCTLSDERKSWCKKFASEYIVDEYKEMLINMLNDPSYIKSLYSNLYLSFYYMSEEEIVREYYEKWQSAFRANVLSNLNLIRFVTEEKKTERAFDVLMILIKNPVMLMIFDYLFKITYGIINGIDVEDFVNRFNNFSEDNKVAAIGYIDKYFIASYREILYRKLKAGIQK